MPVSQEQKLAKRQLLSVYSLKTVAQQKVTEAGTVGIGDEAASLGW